jgi:hypothetical protein
LSKLFFRRGIRRSKMAGDAPANGAFPLQF